MNLGCLAVAGLNKVAKNAEHLVPSFPFLNLSWEFVMLDRIKTLVNRQLDETFVLLGVLKQLYLTSIFIVAAFTSELKGLVSGWRRRIGSF